MIYESDPNRLSILSCFISPCYPQLIIQIPLFYLLQCSSIQYTSSSKHIQTIQTNLRHKQYHLQTTYFKQTSKHDSVFTIQYSRLGIHDSVIITYLDRWSGHVVWLTIVKRLEVANFFQKFFFFNTTLVKEKKKE